MSGTHRYFEIIVAQVSFSRQGTIPHPGPAKSEKAAHRESVRLVHGQASND